MLTEKQLTLRKTGVGGSEAADVCGLGKYRQPLDVWLEKVEGIRDETIGEKESVQFGNILEEPVAKEWARRRGVKVRRNNAVLRHSEHAFMLANIDRRVEGLEEGLEVKTRGLMLASDYGSSGTDQVMTSDLLQCQHYMEVTGWNLWHMAVLIGGQELRSYVIPRDQGLIDNMVELERVFWGYVERKEPPPMIYDHRCAHDLLEKLYPGTNGETVVLPERAVELHSELQSINETIKIVNSEKKAINAEIREMLGESAVGLLPGGGGGWTRKLIQRKGYEVAPSEYFDVRFSKNKG